MARELLVIDDEPQLQQLLRAFFVQRGFRVNTASTAHDALAQLDRVKTDVVLLDLRLPDSSGLEVLSVVKAKFPDVRVVVISGLSDGPTIKEAMHRGASDYLAKPFDFGRCFYAAMGIEMVELPTVQVQPEALAHVPATLAQQYQVLPVSWNEDGLNLVMADPLDVQRIDELQTLLGVPIMPLGVIQGDVSLSAAIERWYGVGAAVQARRPALAKRAPSAEPRPSSAAQPEDASGIIRLVNDLIQHAKASRATDLHIGSSPAGPWIRARIDGMLYDVPVAPQFRELYSSVVSRLKVMANLDIAEHRVPQDGRAWFALGDAKLDLRLSFLPTVHGESVAIRLLEPSRILQLNQLGLMDEQLRQLEPLLARPTGLLLVTGPTGSGKSTSLYAFLAKLNTGQVNLVTIEDPVEHEQAGVTQIQVHPKIGLTFADGLRSMLRHDPDVIMVGEIRDHETAGLAVQASLTGHLVISTLHTNDASSGITRLMDLGIEPFLLCSTLSGILSQRLVRCLCTACREAVELDAASLAHLGVSFPGEQGSVKVWRPTGCKQCRQTGYHGRTGVFEFLPVDHRIRSLIIKRTPSVQIRQSAMANGMRNLLQSCWQKVEAGVTSLEELIRILPADHR